MPLPPKAAPLIAMLASDNEGEAMNALRALKRVLGGAGMDFHDLARGSTPARREPCRVCAERQRREQATSKARGSHAADLKWLLAQPFRYSEREADFLQNLGSWEGDLTEKQAAWFQNILAKVRKAAQEAEF